ncbi:MAG: Hint domain-containing protein, partial [Nitrosopumilus sp.]
GFYAFDWDISTTQTIGIYDITWAYTAEGTSDTSLQTIVVSENSANNPYLYTARRMQFRMALEDYLSCAQNIFLYNEQAQPSSDRATFRWTFENWNPTSRIKIYRNQEIVTDNYQIDYFQGKVVFSSSLISQDVIAADYNFRWFNDDDLNRLLDVNVQAVNMAPPVSAHSIINIPDRFIPIVLYGAARDGIRQMMMCLMFQQPAQLFGDPDRASQIFSQMESLKQNYEKSWEYLIELKKLGRYPNTKNIVTPEYTLPGGRSIIHDALIRLMINGSKEEVTIEELYHIFLSQNNEIKILSQDDNTGEVIYAPVTQVWVSGMKIPYEITTQNGNSIITSDEHLFFVNGEYKPLMDIKVGDELVTHDENIETTEVESVIKLDEEVKMYDLEVNTTANLFAEKIKCHNSRWFRYLFK